MEKTNATGRLMKSWPTYIAEGSTIITGILLALSVDAAWQYRNDRIEERQILEDLRSKFYQDVVEIDEDRQICTEKLAQIELLGSVRTDSLKIAGPADIREALIFTLLNT